jgi:hypothetical protein
MTIEDMLKSRGSGLHFHSLLLLTEPHSDYPGKRPAPRVGILRHLEKLDGQTRDTLDMLVQALRVDASFEGLSPAEFYMLRQRLLCSLDFLARLADSLPAPQWLSTDAPRLELEDRWLLIGVWKEFGQAWLQNLAWRLSRGLPQ